jgi:N-acyl-D-amino-acid deacylase
MRWVSLLAALASVLHAGTVDEVGVRNSVERAIPLLQKAGPAFTSRTGCISCHHNVLPSMAVTAAHDRGFAVDMAAMNDMLQVEAKYLEDRAGRILQGLPPPGAEDTMSYLLFALAASHVPGNDGTDAGVRYLKIRQAADGRWSIHTHRPPLEASSIALTATTIRVLDAFAPPGQRARYRESIRRAAQWLEHATPRNTDEASYRLAGLIWADAAPAAVAQAAMALARAQRPDGGWSQLPTLESDAWASGEALVTLESAGMKTTDSVYARGVAFLVRTQFPDGSWHVKTRSEAIQPYFESGFPYGPDQWISAAGTSWAVTALSLTQRAASVRAVH